MTCTQHGHEVAVRCKRWRTCRGCALWKQWQLSARFLAGVRQVAPGMYPMFFTLTFPLSTAPSEAEAHACWKRLYTGLRREKRLGAFGWVLQRQKNGTLHYHGIAHMTWFEDMTIWRDAVVAAGFGPQQRLEVANPQHARYCCRYISTRLASLEQSKRAYSFTPSFPKPPKNDDAMLEWLTDLGVDPNECEWIPSFLAQ